MTLVGTALLACSSSAWGSPPDVPPNPSADHSSSSPSPSHSPTANVIGLSVAYQAPLSLEKSFPLGGGLFYTREYFVTPRTALGIHAAARVFPQAPTHWALGYGLTLKHYVGNFGHSASDGLYLLYGLLLQMNFLEGRKGSATGHDTRLAIGYDWHSTGLAPLVELGTHITQIRAFDDDTLWWPYTELVVGFRF